MSKKLLAAAIVAVAVLATGGLTVAEAHQGDFYYYNLVVDVVEYERTPYSGFDLVRVTLAIENLEEFDMGAPAFRLGGAPEYRDDPVANPDAPVQSEYEAVTYADVRGRGGDVAVQDCSATDRWSNITAGGTGEASLCFLIGHSFEPDGLAISHWYSVHERAPVISGGYPCVHSDLLVEEYGAWHDVHYGSECDLFARQVVPFNSESAYCFNENRDFCNADNIQPIDGTASPKPEPEPEPPDHAELSYALYHNGTGTLTLVFSELVIASNPDRIELIHDIEAYIDDGSSENLGGAELSTLDGKRQTPILAFTLGDELREEVAASLRAHGDLALVIDSRAIYAADGFVDVTAYHGNGAILVTNLVVVR